MNKKILLSSAALIIVVVGSIFFIMSQSSKNSSSQTLAETDTSTIYTSTQVAQHNKKSDCWTTIDGSVYNLTSYISRHAGGDDIVAACGIDSTSYFNGEQSSTSGRSQDHSNNRSALSDLKKLKIGVLEK